MKRSTLVRLDRGAADMLDELRMRMREAFVSSGMKSPEPLTDSYLVSAAVKQAVMGLRARQLDAQRRDALREKANAIFR